MAPVSSQAHGEHVTEFMYQDGGESDSHPIDGEPGIALIASDQKNGEPEKRMDPDFRSQEAETPVESGVSRIIQAEHGQVRLLTSKNRFCFWISTWYLRSLESPC